MDREHSTDMGESSSDKLFNRASWEVVMKKMAAKRAEKGRTKDGKDGEYEYFLSS